MADLDPSLMMAEKLADAVLAFVEALAEVWPTDSGLRDGHKYLMNQSKKDVANLVCNTFDKSYDELAYAKDARVLDHPSLVRYSARAKYDSANSDIQDAIWDHVKRITEAVTVFRVYASVPSSLMNMITSLTSDISAKLEAGTMDQSELNPLALGQKILAQMNAADMKSMTEDVFGNLGNDPATLMRMMNSMSSMLPPGAASSLPGGGMSEMISMMQGTLGANGGTPDPATLMRLMDSLMPPKK